MSPDSGSCWRFLQFRTPATLTVEELPSHLKAIFGEVVQLLHVERRSVDLRRGGSLSWNFILQFPAAFSRSAEKTITRFGGSRCETPRDLNPCLEPEYGRPAGRPIVVGAGVSGLVAGLLLARAGCCPLVLEQGKDLDDRVRDVQRLHRHGELLPLSNVQFGLGGAGTFSDAKLNSRTKSPWRRYILQLFARFGAPPSIVWDAMPHAGTDRIRQVAAGLRDAIRDAGGEVRFSSCVAGLDLSSGSVHGVILADGSREEADAVFLCPGNAARDLFRALAATSVPLAAKEIAVGFRLEHEQELIDRLIYRKRPLRALFGPASYGLSAGSAWSFCVCPGGIVVNSSTQPEGLCLNGMSFSGRRGRCINGALVTPVKPAGDGDPLHVMRWQEDWEARASQLGGGGQIAPAQEASGFLSEQKRGKLRWSTYRPGIQSVELEDIFPMALNRSLRQGLGEFQRRFPGFVDGLLLGIEARTSSPVRIIRGPDGMSTGIRNLYPCGEGAGYAGGILTSALDGLEQVLRYLHREGHPG